MSSPDLQRMIKEAAEAAKHAPEHLQESAFNRAFELLAAQTQANGVGLVKRKTPATSDETVDADIVADLAELDRTAHPEIRHDRGTLENALRVLRAAKADLGVDGLHVDQVAESLRNTFRCPVKDQAVRMALERATSYVHRTKRKGKVVYRLMAPGDHYLDQLDAGDDREVPRPGRKGRARAMGGASRATTKRANGVNANKPIIGRPSAAKAIKDLLASGFFSVGRTLSSMTSKLKHDLGRSYKASELQPALLRALRRKEIAREKNAEGQYEYSEP